LSQRFYGLQLGSILPSRLGNRLDADSYLGLLHGNVG
jgi:hypothetical protein